MPKIMVNHRRLRRRQLYIAVPCYGGMLHVSTAQSLSDLTAALARQNITFKLNIVNGGALIAKVRSDFSNDFLRSGFSHLLFIDADIGFDPADVIYMLATQDDESDYDVLAAPYALKSIDWSQVKRAVEKGSTQQADSLAEFAGKYVLEPFFDETGKAGLEEDRPTQVRGAGTGFMMIRRRTFTSFAAGYPELRHRLNNQDVTLFFSSEIYPGTMEHMGEDLWFCRKVRDLGMKVWICAWMRPTHTGNHTFKSNLAALAAISEPPSAR